MKEIRLNARVRTESGKQNLHKIRKQGEIPGVLYGHKAEPVHLAIVEHDFWTILHHATSEHLILSIDIEGLDEDNILTLVKDVQHHPVSGNVLHVDFQRIAKDETIKVGVHVLLTGIPKGVKDFGGILDHGIREVMISTTPVMIPEALEMDVSALLVGDSVRVSDMVTQYPDIEFLDDDSIQVAHVSIPKKLEVAEDLEAEEAAEGEEGDAAPAEGEEAAAEGEES
ncbi:MAG: 50S ribosomal protein L25 [Candidatus Krumholzibacteria bacterium]|nr:50S ribosomal protein L25 [Candidatus Krumholzibacteria bacterium]